MSRGGGTFDRFANVFYVSGHYQSYAYLPETPGLFSGSSHAALVVSAMGPGCAVTRATRRTGEMAWAWAGNGHGSSVPSR